MNAFFSWANTRSFWWSLVFAGCGLMAIALYYQHVLGEQPCQVCIQARLWVVAFTLTALLMTCLPLSAGSRGLANLLVLGAAVGLGERAWTLYQLENGKGTGSCEFQLGMPDWFAVDRWFPELFEVRNLCSFTPEMLFGLTMAEALLVAAGVVGALALLGALTQFLVKG
jgi:disulfide bond formation protein DsbB